MSVTVHVHAGTSPVSSLVKAAKRRSPPVWCARRRSQSLDGALCADQRKSLDMHGKSGSAPPKLADAQSILPRALLQGLREEALARYAWLLLLPHPV